MLRAALILAVFCSTTACADDLDARLARIRVAMASEDPAERETAGRELEAVAEEAGARLAALLQDRDSEVAGRAWDVLARNGMFPADGDPKRFRALLDACAAGSRETRRVDLERAVSDFGAIGAGYLRRELAEGAFEPVAPPCRVVSPRGARPVELRVVNRGKLGCWVPADDVLAMPHLEPFGRKPVRILRCGGCKTIFRGGGPDPRTPQQRFLDELAGRRRVPPGAEWVVASVAVPDRCGILRVRGVWQGRTRVEEAEFHGQLLRVNATPESPLPVVDVAMLGERDGDGFSVMAAKDGESWVLRVEALRELPASVVNGQFENAWWAAEGADGDFLGSGPLATRDEDRTPWTKGDARSFRMTDAVPAGARRLWLGYDHNFVNNEGVAKPIELR